MFAQALQLFGFILKTGFLGVAVVTRLRCKLFDDALLAKFFDVFREISFTKATASDRFEWSIAIFQHQQIDATFRARF
jgi:hypothetical protein